MRRGGRRLSQSVVSVLEESEQNLLSAFKKSSETRHPGSKGNARANGIADFLRKRLPDGYGVLCFGEIVDYLDTRSGEFDILIFDRVRNSVLSDDPLWAPAESLLAYIEVKSTLSYEELKKTYLAAMKINSLKPFERCFTLAGNDTNAETHDSLRCFRTLFAYGTDLKDEDWLNQEWKRVVQASTEAKCELASIDRILVLNRGMINPPSGTGTDQFEVSSVLQQWYTNLVNFLARENGRRPSIDWELYSKTKIPGWRKLSA
jgi:hypothetical protein